MRIVDIVQKKIGIELLIDQPLWLEGENFSRCAETRSHHDRIIAKIRAPIEDMIAWLYESNHFSEMRFPRLALENLPGDEIILKQQECAIRVFNKALVHLEAKMPMSGTLPS